MKWTLIVLCCALLECVAGNSLKDPYICGPPSCTPSEKFKYSSEIIYHYEYKVNVETWFAESSNNKSTLEVKAIALVEFITPCEGLLQLSDVSLVDQDENYPVERATNFVHAVSLYQLRFAFHDGVISELCPEEHEQQWVLNFKRGLLSLLQNTMKRFDINYKGIERDIHGTCTVDYTVRGQENTSLVVMKSRDLTQCTDRHNYKSILQTVRYNFNSKFQTWPVLNSENKCRITIDHNVYKSVSCKERHLFEPFSGKNSGAMTTVVQELLLVKEANKTDSQIMESQPKTYSVIKTRSNLLHHHTTNHLPATGDLKSAREVLKMLCRVKEDSDDGDQSAQQKLESDSLVSIWGSLVLACRSLSHPALSQLLLRVDSLCPTARKHILDALPYIASAGSVELIKDMLLEGSVDGNTAHEWLMSMAMIPRPKYEMLSSMLELLRKQRTDKVVSFTVSSMLHSYCKHSGNSLRECCLEEAPKQIVNVFTDVVNELLKQGLGTAPRETRDAIVIAIKALGNIGGFNQEFADVLMNIISDPLAPVNIRLTAVDAFRRMPCLETREYFLEMYRMDHVSVEVRIASYLQVMRCPSLSTIRKIFHAREHEPVNQVATFVWSHMNNLGESSLPSRVEIQGLLSGNTIPPLTDEPDFRMYSRNYEQSVFYDKYNAGGNVESNVIFSPDSYIPRSLSLNLTIDMFGESINLLELKGRGEGFERYFESIFGNNGPLSKTKFNDYVQNLRFFRSVNDAKQTRAKIDDLNYKNEALKHQFPMAELGVKVFGNEIAFWSLEGDTEIRNTLTKLNPKFRILEILSGKEISYNKASLFLDTTYSVPTGSGLPLNMHLMGTSYVNMNMSGAMKDNGGGDNKSGDLGFEGNLHPSVAVNVAATMGVLAGGLSSTGIRVNMRLYTSTAVQAKLSVRGIKDVKLELSLPRSKQQIFAAKSELIILHGEVEHQQQGLNRNRIEQNTCSWSAFDQAIGIKVCAAYQFPNMTNLRNAPYFIMSGPAQYTLSLEKADPSAKNYLFQYNWQQNRTAHVFNLSFDTPNSQEKRMFNAIMSLSENSSTAQMSFQSSKSTVEARALYRNYETDKCVEAKLDINGHKHFDTVMSLKRYDIKFGYVWVPHAYWVVNDERVAELTGSLKSKSKGGVTQWDISAEFQTKQLASRLVGYYTINGPTQGTKLQLDYQFYKNPKQTIKLDGLYSERAIGFRHDLYGELAMEFSAYPGYNFYSVFRNMKTLSHLDVGLNVSSSRAGAENPAFSFALMRVDRINGVKFATHLILVKPKPVKMQLRFEEIGPKYTGELLLNFNPASRDITVSGSVYVPRGTQLFLEGELVMQLPTLHPATLALRLHEKLPQNYQVNAQGVWFTGVDYNIDAVYQDQSKTNMASHRLKIFINSSHFKDIAADARFTQDNRQITFIGQGEYNSAKYRALFRHVLLSQQNFTSYLEVDADGHVYSAALNADLTNYTDVSVDLHFDQLRDVHMSYQRWSTAKQKRLSAALSWDANRDPSQRLSVDLQLDSLAAWQYRALAQMYYPGQRVSADLDFLYKDWLCKWQVRLGWSDDDVILWNVNMYSEAKEQTVYALLSKLNTPFHGWRDTSFNVMWKYQNNMQAIDGSMNWQEEYLSFALLADYLFKTNEFYGQMSAVVNSTIATLPKAAAVAKHRLIWNKSADTLLSFQYNDEGKLMINSSWVLDRGNLENNVSGKVTLITPFQGYRNGFLQTKFVLGHKRDINGVTFLDLEDKVLKIYVNGHMRRITNSMLVINVTSPVTDTARMTARFGFVESDRHLVAMVVTPASTTGIEVLLKLISLQDFHVFGHIALPIQYLNRAMITAKRAQEEVDFRVGWGAMDFGFTGIWHYKSPLNFVYLYKLYTPLDDFEENGFVLKNIYGPGLDTELYLRLSKHKFGIAILLRDTGKGLLDVIRDKFQHKQTNSDILIENFDTTARVTLDTLYYPTVTFHARLMKYIGAEEEDILEVNATLHLPNKTAIVLTDLFILEDLSVMRNTLNLVTPFQAVREIKSVYTVDIVMGEKINITCLALLYNGTYWHEISYKMYYEYETGDDDAYQSYIASLGIVTPLAVLPSLDSSVSVRLEDALWKMAADIGMPSFTITAHGTIELDDPFVETSGSLNLTSIYLQDYFIKMEFKKDFSELENVVGGGIQVQQGEHNNYLYTDVVWHTGTQDNIKIKSRAALHPVLPPTDLLLHYYIDRPARSRGVSLDLTCGNETSYSVVGDYRSNGVSVSIATSHDQLRTAKLLAEFEADDIRGSFVTDKLEYGITGKVLNSEPLEMALTLVPKGKGETINVKIKYNFTTTSYAVSAHLSGPLALTVHARLEAMDNYTDVNFKVDIPAASNRELFLKSRLESRGGLRRVLTVQAATPLNRIKYINADTDFVFGPNTGYVLCKYSMPDMRGDGDLKWSFVRGDLFIKALGHQLIAAAAPRSVDLDIYFGNSTAAGGLQSNDAGFRMDLDRVWQIGANASFGYIMNQQLSLTLHATLPAPNVDVHSVRILAAAAPKYSVTAQYCTDVTRQRYMVDGTLLNLPESMESNSTILWQSVEEIKTIDNKIIYSWDINGSHLIDYALSSPLYENVTTFTVKGSYQPDTVHGYKVVKGIMHRPGTSQIGEIDMRYGGVRHTDGHLNVTTPFKHLHWLRSVFDINNVEEHSNNKVLLYWPNKTASVNTTHVYTKLDIGFEQNGDIAISIPLNSQHEVRSQYYYVQGHKHSNGNATVDFDTERFVKASFKQNVEKSERQLELTTTDVEVENQHTPVGIKYIHEFDDTGNIDVKQATVFHLYNVTKFNVTGKIDSLTFDNGKNLKLTAMHGQRTLTFENEYEAKDKELKQGSKIKWAKDVWLKYDIHVTNMTADDTESQQLTMNVFYPLRTFNLVALYRLQDTLLDGNATLHWNVRDDNKSAELRGRWENPPVKDKNVHLVDLALAHPSFSKDVTLKGQYISTPLVMSNISLEVQYSDYESEYLRLKSILTDNSNGPIRDYKFALKCSHPATNLDLEMRSDINIKSRWYYFDNYYRFQKSLFYQKLRHFKLLTDLNNSLIKYERVNETNFLKWNGTWNLHHPEYNVIATVVRPTGNDTAVAKLDWTNRALVAHYNSTDDVSYHLIGAIIDTRSAKMSAWRDFDDVTTVDLASYIRLNHSRLLTSSVVWRPEIFTEIKGSLVQNLKQVYNQINDTLVIIKEAPMEAHQALKSIWTDARPRIKDFLEDLNDLHVIKDDLDDFERFLNESYNENDFYVKDIVEFTYYVLDEMALRNHLESLPGIVNDMWGMMGNTSQSIKQSLTYVVDTVKHAYANFLEQTNKFLEADFMELVSDKLEAAIMQYDTFVRDLHMKLLDYWEATWVNATNRLSKYWHELLKSMEPLFFKVVHYTESFVFTVWRGVMDFFYSRTQELTDSPYFNYVSTFGHEMDKMYKDLVNNDLITNIKKYSRKLGNFIWSKIEKYVPFLDELTQLYAEFKNAWDNFLQTPQVLYVRDKYREGYSRLKWWYDYFLIGEAFDRVWDIMYDKLTDMARTALQYEELHRTPKTNFIFDPRKGEITLEQKLPMSWHAFNRSPDFSEIPEYKAARDFMDDWLTTNKSIWSYYYEIRPYLDIDNIMPPFAGMAMMTGQGTLVTFDKQVFTITENGTFLLTKDYRQNNITVLMESNDQGNYNLVLLTRNHLIHVDLYKEVVWTEKSGGLVLPRIIDGCLIERQSDTLTLQTSQVTVTCHFLFRTCKIHVSGWYYASLGGLLGTFNNEHYDDLQLPNSTITSSIPDLAHSWNLEPALMAPSVQRLRAESKGTNDTQCDKFFRNNVSPLHPCFNVIDATPFLLECERGASACALADAYLELCNQQHIPTHAPDQCLQCTTPQGDIIEEGSFHTMETVPSSSDVVFIVEAHTCNRNLRKMKNMDLFIETFDSKLQSSGLTDNRYAIVVFGGNNVYSVPRSLYKQDRVFLNAIEISQHFDNLLFDAKELNRTGRGPADMFAALSHALQLPRRAAAPAALLLLPCAACDARAMRLDYSTIFHALVESSASLHILMDDEFTLAKRRAAKYLFGVDSTLAYTNKDFERLTGDAALRKQVKLPKEKLGLCMSLALETNGTVFAGKKLSGERSTARRFGTVLGARAAAAAAAAAACATNCECRRATLHCPPCANTQHLMELSFWNSEDIEDLIDLAMEPPNLSTLS